MEENKYYTPTVDEFYIGFEYELLILKPIRDDRFGIMLKKEMFDSKRWSNVSWNVDFTEDLKNGKIRVKYLDKEDIESFGFKFDATRSKVDGNFVGSYENEKYYLDYSPHNYNGSFNSNVHLRIMKIKDFPITSYQNNYQFIYDGIVKNKSELKKLLIQLEIIDGGK